MKHRPWLFEIMLGMAIAWFLQMILHFFRSWCLLRWQGSLALRMCSRFFEHVLRLPIDFFQQRFTGDIVSRLRLGEEITTFVTGPFAQVALDFLVAMLYLVLLIIYDPLLTAFGVVFTCGNLVLTYFVYQWLAAGFDGTEKSFQGRSGRRKRIQPDSELYAGHSLHVLL